MQSLGYSISNTPHHQLLWRNINKSKLETANRWNTRMKLRSFHFQADKWQRCQGSKMAHRKLPFALRHWCDIWGSYTHTNTQPIYAWVPVVHRAIRAWNREKDAQLRGPFYLCESGIIITSSSVYHILQSETGIEEKCLHYLLAFSGVCSVCLCSVCVCVCVFVWCMYGV